MIKHIGVIERASESTIMELVEIGALNIDDTGIHASEPGTYSNKESTSDR